MRNRTRSLQPGFTLVELLVAIVITGIVALLAYAALTAGLDTLARVEAHRRQAQSRALVRPLLADALRHVADAQADGLPAFMISQASSSSPGSSLTFLTRGVENPLGSSGLWKIGLSTSVDGLLLRAEPLENRSRPAFETVVPGVKEVRFRVLPTRQDRIWVTNWESSRQHPYALKIEMLDSTGTIMDAPLVLAMSFERGRQ